MPLLANHEVDYTNFFINLRNDSIHNEDLLADSRFQQWLDAWKLVQDRNDDQVNGLNMMDKNNPVIIPRNHLVEEALSHATKGDMSTFNKLLNENPIIAER